MSSLDRFAGGLALALVAGCGASPPPASPMAATPPAPDATSPAPSESADTAAPAGPVVIARGLGPVDDVVASDAFLYVAKKKTVITRIPLNGGPPADIATFENQATIEAIAASDEGVYILITAIGKEATKEGYAGQGSLFLVPAKGGDAQALAQGFRKPTALVVEGSQVHWTAISNDGKKMWSLFSAPRKTGAPMTEAALAETGPAAKVPAEQKTARLLGVFQGQGVVAWDKGGVFLHPFDHAVGGTALSGLAGYPFSERHTALKGGQLAIGGSVSRDGKPISVVGTVQLGAPGQELVPLATLDAATVIGGVAFAGDDVVYSLAGTKEKHDKDGSIVRVSADRKTTVLATDQFQAAKLLVTSRGLIWLDKGATDTDELDGALVLLPR